MAVGTTYFLIQDGRGVSVTSHPCYSYPPDSGAYKTDQIHTSQVVPFIVFFIALRYYIMVNNTKLVWGKHLNHVCITWLSCARHTKVMYGVHKNMWSHHANFVC